MTGDRVRIPRRWRKVVTVAGAMVLAWSAIGALQASAATTSALATGVGSSGPGPIDLAGVFSILPGRCRPGHAPAGSYLQLQIDGIPVPNPTSACGILGSLYTPLKQGSEGLVTGGYQLDPVPTFDRAGDSQAGAIIDPVRYLTTELGLATTCADQGEHPTASGACRDQQAGNPVPSLSAEAPGSAGCPAGSASWCVYGDLSALSGSWAGVPIEQLLAGPGTCANELGCFDQGVVAGPGLSPSFEGTYDRADGSYTLDIRTATPTGIMPAIDATYVLTGTFTPGPPAPSIAPGSIGGGLGDSAGSAGGATGTSRLGASGVGASGVGGSAAGVAPSGGAEEAAQSPVLASDTARLLTGTLQLAPASCTGGTPTGSYLVVTYGTGTAPNPASTCVDGTYTMLPPGKSGLPIGQFAPDPVPTFDANGDSLADTVIEPVPFGHHKLGMGTSADDLQDAPSGPAIYSPPEALVEGQTLLVDLRSLDVTYGGPPGASCRSGFGQGCWQEGVRAAVGTFDPTSDNWTLDWQASQGFTGASAAVTFHLEGHFTGTSAAAPQGTGDGWLPAQYVVVGGSTQSSGPGGSRAGGTRSAAANGTGSSVLGGDGGIGARAGGKGTGNGRLIGGIQVPRARGWQQWTAVLVGLLVLASIGGLLAAMRRLPALRAVALVRTKNARGSE